MSLEGFGEARRVLATLARAVPGKASAPSAAGASSQAEDYQALERMAAQNMVAVKVRAGMLNCTRALDIRNSGSPGQNGHQGGMPSCW